MGRLLPTHYVLVNSLSAEIYRHEFYCFQLSTEQDGGGKLTKEGEQLHPDSVEIAGAQLVSQSQFRLEARGLALMSASLRGGLWAALGCARGS